jgi:tetratricopeptide (TPR) repeat protein
MTATVRSLDAARHATVRICDRNGTHFGQGLMLALDGEGTVVLTCHHVVSRLTAEDLHVAVVQPSGALGQPVRATYDPQRSHQAMDAVVLRVDETGPRERPLLHALNPQAYSGSLPDRAIGLGHWKTDSFDARVASTTKLDLHVGIPGIWPDPPTRYQLPLVFRLADPSDARPGISGSVVLYENGVLGLAHFSRAAGPDQEREVYLVPLSVWSNGWSTLTDLIEPLIDARLRNAATVKRAGSLEIGTDILIAGYRSDVYFEPEALSQARAALSNRGGVIVLGRPKSGKTRLAWQLFEGRPDSLVVIPGDPRPPNSFETSGLAGKEIVLFIDDLHRSALSIEPLEWRRRLEEATGQRCLLICTSRDGDDWKQVERSGASRLIDVLGRDALVFSSRVGGQGADLSKADGLRLAQALAISEHEFGQRFDGTPGSLTLDLAEMGLRYLRLRDEQRAGISMSRLLDAAKLAYEASQPRLRVSVLRAIAEQIRGDGRVSAEAWETLQRRTNEEGFGVFDSTSGDFRTYQPYLEDCVTYEPSAHDIEGLVSILLDAQDSDGLGYLGQALFMRYASYPAAERALRAAIDFGNQSVTSQLAWVLSGIPGREAETEGFYRSRIEAGETGEYHNLGNLLSKEAGREGDAEKAFRDFIELSNEGLRALGYWSLGNLLIRQQGREQEAERAYREAKDRGLFMAHLALVKLLASRPGLERETEQAISEALEAIEAQRANLSPDSPAGDGKNPARSPWILLDGMRGEALRCRGSVLARQPGREAEAESAFRDAINAGDREAYVDLGALLANQPSREQEAERAFRVAAEAGLDSGTANLGHFLVGQPGREAEAEQLVRKAIDAGVKVLYLDLGRLLAKQPGRAQEAEQALHEAIATGASEAHECLGWLFEQQPGREQEAESVYRMAIDAGAADASMRLGSLLEGQAGREKDAEDVYRDAIRHGDRRAWRPLVSLLMKRAFDGDPGLDDEVERALTTEIEAGDPGALYGLGVLLALQPGRRADGCEMLRKATATGIAGASDALQALCEG